MQEEQQTADAVTSFSVAGDPAPAMGVEETVSPPSLAPPAEEPASTPAPAAVEDEGDLLEDEHEEVHDAEMAAMLESSFEMPEEGSLIDGTIISITNEDVMVAVGGKSESVIPIAEFKTERETGLLKVGQTFELVCKGTRSGQPVLSRIEARRRVGEEHLKKAFESGEPITAHAVRRTKGGLKVEAEGMAGFMPFSHSGIRRGHEAEIEALVGTTFQALVVEPPTGKNMVVSRRLWLEKESEKNRHQALNELRAGASVTGKVKHLTHFGAFIDLGGIDGLLHVKDMSWGHVAKPEDVVQLGQELDVLVLSIEGEKVALGLKQKTSDPWESFETQFPTGSRCQGTVTSLAQYGAFVMLECGIEGLIHISELSWTKRIRHPSDILKVGDAVQVVVLGFDRSKRRVSLGFKQTSEDPWERITTEHPEGSSISGRVVSLTNFGAFVSLADGVDGMIHVSDLSWSKKINHPSEVLKEGDFVEAKVLKIDRANRKISLGMKQAKPDPWSTASSKYREGTVVTATINNLADFGAFAEIEPGLDGLIHISEISNDRVNRPADALTLGQQVKAVIKHIDWEKRKVGLSMKALEDVPDLPEPSYPSPMADREPASESLSDFGQLLNSALEKGKRRRE